MLKTLTVRGFKSFPEKTVIEFGRGITAVVGPNGSGKSNVTDAIRWGLGEQNVRLLRGQRMSDMIFNGTAKRQAMGYSEVELVFDNSGRIIPMEADTVVITRRYFRSGESEYYLNNHLVRLKEITDLLTDTGIGMKGYSIVGQGKIDEVLTEKAEDRRLIFDEAAGIVQFKNRKADAQNQLATANLNLERAEDIIGEINVQIEPLRAQKKAYEKYEEIYERFKNCDIAVARLQYEQVLEQQENDGNNTRIAQYNLNEALQALERLNRECSGLASQYDNMSAEISLKREKFNALSVKKADLMGARSLLDERKTAALKRLAQIKYESEHFEDRDGSFAQEKQKLEDKLVATRQLAAQTENALRQQEKVLQEIESSIALERQNASQKRKLMQSHNQELLNLNNRLSTAAGEAQSVVAQKQTLSENLAAELLVKDQKQVSLSAAQEQLSALQKLKTDITAKLEDIKKVKYELLQKVSAKEEAYESNHRQLNECRYKKATLQQLEERFEGYQHSVQKLMQDIVQKTVDGRGVYGPLGTLVSVPQQYAVAIDIALGGSIHNIVCDTETTAKAMVRYLRNKKLGRATFLPLQDLSIKKIDPLRLKQAEHCQGFVGVASELVTIDQEMQKALDFSCNRILVAETIDDALHISAATEKVYKIVTLDGDVVNPGGSITGGSISHKDIGLAGRTAQIRKLAVLEKNFVSTEQKCITELEDIKCLIDEQTEHEGELLRQRNQNAEALAGLEASLKNLKDSVFQAAAIIEKHETDLQKLNARLEELQRIKTDSERALHGLQEEISNIGSEIARTDETDAAEASKRELAKDEVQRLALKMQQQRDAIANMSENLENLTAQQREYQAQKSRLKAEKTELEQTVNDAGLQDEAAMHKILQVEKSLTQTENDIKAADIAMKGLNDQKQQLQTELADKNQEIGILRGEIAKLESMNQRHQRDGEEILNRMWETYALTKTEILQTPEDPAKISLAGMIRERNKQKHLLDETGPVNPNAVKDYDVLAKRLETMTAQRDDILTVKNDLNTVINDLETAMRDTFTKTFREISENFAKAFHELFNGGVAQLSLEGEGDILEHGIEIMAQPPGKKLQRLSLLSGGERSLTAIALIFAILHLKPTPFVIFDEIESALDDINVERFKSYMTRYANKLQFVVVTHRKDLMESADYLYGVSMQEKGVSGITSLKFNK